jgi:hypothetical protein
LKVESAQPALSLFFTETVHATAVPGAPHCVGPGARATLGVARVKT